MHWIYEFFTKSALVTAAFLRTQKSKKIEYRRDSSALLASHYCFSHGERTFLSVLEKAVGSHYYVIGKVKAFELLAFDNDSSFYAKTVKKNFSGYYFDYVVCTAHSHQVVCVVELERVHITNKRKRRWSNMLEILMQQFCINSDLARLIVAEQRGYDLNELIERFEGVTKDVEIALDAADVYVL
jgi:hypothetical protein